MTNQNYTHIAVLLDRSGSMQTIKSDTEGGFDAFIAEQRKSPGRCDVTLAQFDTEYEEVYVAKPLANVPPLHLSPRGGTALLDGIGRLINTTGERLAAMPETDRPAAVIMVIMTDGQENSSREFDLGSVNRMITEQTDTYGWTFVYLGANQDAIAVAAGLGVAADQAMTYAGRKVDQAFAATSANLTRYREAIAGGVAPAAARHISGYTQEQRKSADE
ncbi:MAG: VWA domain-containing protein [Microlunatus sp.]|nr:VWA domain-containing protein [Microlunatus sp.]